MCMPRFFMNFLQRSGALSIFLLKHEGHFLVIIRKNMSAFLIRLTLRASSNFCQFSIVVSLLISII